MELPIKYYETRLYGLNFYYLSAQDAPMGVHCTTLTLTALCGPSNFLLPLYSLLMCLHVGYKVDICLYGGLWQYVKLHATKMNALKGLHTACLLQYT